MRAFLCRFIFFIPSQGIEWEERIRNDRFIVEWDVKPRVVFVGGDARDFPCHWFPSSTSLTTNLPSQPGKATFPTTGVGQSKIRC